MGPVQALKTCLRKSFQFSGRASRSEFWWFMTFAVSFVGIASAVDYANNRSGFHQGGLSIEFWKFSRSANDLITLGFFFDPEHQYVVSSWHISLALLPPITGFASLAATVLMLPGAVSALARRAHDIGWSAYPFVAFFFFPLIVLGPTGSYLNSTDGFNVGAVILVGLFQFLLCVPIVILAVFLMKTGEMRAKPGPNPLEVTP